MNHLDDEQLTAFQDGDGSPEARAHVAGCDRCGRRAEALAAVAALVATPPPPPSEPERRAAVAAALAAADRPAAPRQLPARRRVPAWLLPAAAVVALLALVAAVVPQLVGRSDDDSETAAQRTDRGAESPDGGDAGAAGGGVTEERAARAAPPGQTDLGVVHDEAELVERVRALVLAQSATADESASAGDRCSASFSAAGEPLGPLRLRAALEWQGQAAEVFSDGQRAVVVAAGGCTALADVTLP
jgi:hypothetical protein